MGAGDPVRDLAPGLERLFESPVEEAAYPVAPCRGAIPAWLRGDYYVNGPASFHAGDLRYQHWLDGDGMVVALRLDGDECRFRSRFVVSKKRRDEQQEGRAIYRAFGTRFEGDRLRRGMMLQPPVNVSVLPFAGALLALGEHSLPVEMDPVTLATRGDYDFGGVLNEVSPFAAHAKLDRRDGALVNFGVAYGAERTTLHLYEFDSRGRKIRRSRQTLEAPYTLHDFALVDDFAVFHLGPYFLDAQRLLDGASLMESLRFERGRPAKLLLLPRRKGAAAVEVEVESGYCLHLINGFQEGDRVWIDLMLFDRPLYPEYQPLPELFQTVSKGRPVRYRVDLGSGNATCEARLDEEFSPDFPAVTAADLGRRYEQFWRLEISHAGRPGRKFFDQLARCSWADAAPDRFTLPAGEYFGGEPVHLAGPTPQDGLVMVQHFLTARDEAAFWLFRAERIADGPQVEIPLRSRMRPGFHSYFAADSAPGAAA